MTFEEEYDPVDIEDYLAHYGRKGMKWYQHIFGERQSNAKYNKSNKEDYKTLSDEELRSRINRIRLEREYKSLSSNGIGKKIVISVLGAMGAASLGVVKKNTANAEIKLGKKAVEMAFKVLAKRKK